MGALARDSDRNAAGPGWRGILTTVLAVLYLSAILTPLQVWQDGGWVPVPSVELLALGMIGLVLRSLASSGGRWVPPTFAGVLLVLVVLTTADGLLLRIFGRPLDIPLDIHLLPALSGFFWDALGRGRGWAWSTIFLISALLLYCCNLVALRQLSTSFGSGRGRWAIASATALVLFGHVASGGAPVARCASVLPLSCSAVEMATRQVSSAIALWRPMPAFDRKLAEDPLAKTEAPILDRLRNVDVLLVFVESYGTAALRDDRYAGRILPHLDRIESDLRGRGLVVASGRLEAPTVGGLSWLSHATMLSGLWLDNQRRYNRLLTSDRRTLVHLFEEAGHRTVGIFPQILRPWPEGRFFGYDQIWTSQNIDYVGPPFGWTTMPDQYTLWFLQQSERLSVIPRPPLFAEVALISSHAPWEPVPPLLQEWDTMGEGEPFRQLVDPDWDGPRGWPAEASHNYLRTIEYSLNAIAGFASRFAGDDILMIVVGDHQPAALITGPNADRTVPMHVVASSAELIRPFLKWGFAPSMRPPLDQNVKRMDAFRTWFVEAFSGAETHPAVSQRLE